MKKAITPSAGQVLQVFQRGGADSTEPSHSVTSLGLEVAEGTWKQTEQDKSSISEQPKK